MDMISQKSRRNNWFIVCPSHRWTRHKNLLAGCIPSGTFFPSSFYTDKPNRSYTWLLQRYDIEMIEINHNLYKWTNSLKKLATTPEIKIIFSFFWIFRGRKASSLGMLVWVRSMAWQYTSSKYLIFCFLSIISTENGCVQLPYVWRWMQRTLSLACLASSWYFLLNKRPFLKRLFHVE